MTYTLMAQFDNEWARLAHSTHAARAQRALALREPTIAALGAVDLGDLVTLVRRGPDSLPPDDAAMVLAAMLRSADAHPLVPRATFQCLLGGTVRAVRGLGPLVDTWDDAQACYADALIALWAVIRAWGGQDRPYAALDVLSAVRCRLRRQAWAVLAERRRTVALDVDLVAAPPDRSDLEALAQALAAPADLGLDPTDATIISLSRVYGYSLREVADVVGQNPNWVQHRRAMAERQWDLSA